MSHIIEKRIVEQPEKKGKPGKPNKARKPAKKLHRPANMPLKDYPTVIIKTDGTYVVLQCPVCRGNAHTKKSETKKKVADRGLEFMYGIVGMKGHVGNAHKAISFKDDHDLVLRCSMPLRGERLRRVKDDRSGAAIQKVRGRTDTEMSNSVEVTSSEREASEEDNGDRDNGDDGRDEQVEEDVGADYYDDDTEEEDDAVIYEDDEEEEAAIYYDEHEEDDVDFENDEKAVVDYDSSEDDGSDDDGDDSNDHAPARPLRYATDAEYRPVMEHTALHRTDTYGAWSNLMFPSGAPSLGAAHLEKLQKLLER